MKGTARASATRCAAAWASSFDLPTTKFSKVKRGSSGALTSSGAKVAAGWVSPRAGSARPGSGAAGTRSAETGLLGLHRLGTAGVDNELDAADLRIGGMPEGADALGIMLG